MARKSKAIPRFVLSLTDTKNVMPGPDGERYFSTTIGFDDFEQLRHPIPEEDGGNELNRVIRFFQEAVTNLDGEKVIERGEK